MYLKSIQPLLPGYPQWYIDLCSKYKGQSGFWDPGPHKLTTGVRVVPKLMKLTWDGYILHHTIEHGWGFLVPYTVDLYEYESIKDENEPVFPYEEYIKMVKPLGKNQDPYYAADSLEDERSLFNDLSLLSEGNFTKNTEWLIERPEFRSDVKVFGCLFYKLVNK